MASTIQIKRNTATGQTPQSLAAGELAVNVFDRKLYVGNNNVPSFPIFSIIVSKKVFGSKISPLFLQLTKILSMSELNNTICPFSISIFDNIFL